LEVDLYVVYQDDQIAQSKVPIPVLIHIQFSDQDNHTKRMLLHAHFEVFDQATFFGANLMSPQLRAKTHLMKLRHSIPVVL